MKFSPQQQAFLDWCANETGSCVLEARAGTGKTTTALAAVTYLKGSIAYLAFNKKIADELKARLLQKGVDWKKAQAGTVHSFGFSALRKAFGNVKVNDKKVDEILDAILGADLSNLQDLDDDMVDDVLSLAPHFRNLRHFKGDVLKLVSLAKQNALGVVTGPIENAALWFDIIDHHDLFQVDKGEPNPPMAELVKLSQLLLKMSNQVRNVVDFDDMVYGPLVWRVRFWQFDNVVIDEAQDTNASRRALVRALVKRGGRVIAIGDPFQAIYGFTGADNDALDLIAQDFKCVNLPLTVTYRCPKAVVAFAQRWVSDIEAHESSPEGSVSEETLDVFMKRKDLNGKAAVICRVNKPLVKLAFQLIKNRIPCKVEGRDIGKGLQKLATRWKIKTLEALEKRLETYLANETTKLLAKKQEARLQSVVDQVETLKVIIEQCRADGIHSIDGLKNVIDALFADDVKGMLTLSSIHKSKGREWDRVFWFDRAGTCPSKWARQSWQQDQERNLQYVAATRAKDQLIDLLPIEAEAAA